MSKTHTCSNHLTRVHRLKRVVSSSRVPSFLSLDLSPRRIASRRHTFLGSHLYAVSQRRVLNSDPKMTTVDFFYLLFISTNQRLVLKWLNYNMWGGYTLDTYPNNFVIRFCWRKTRNARLSLSYDSTRRPMQSIFSSIISIFIWIIYTRKKIIHMKKFIALKKVYHSKKNSPHKKILNNMKNIFITQK